MSEIKEPVPARAAAYVAIYPMLQSIAKDHGYALAVHGSVRRDFDLVAVPWIEEASEPLTLLKAIKEATKAIIHSDDVEVETKYWPDLNPTKKPHGRLAYALHLTNKGMYGGYLDVSVMPKILPSVVTTIEVL